MEVDVLQRLQTVSSDWFGQGKRRQRGHICILASSISSSRTAGMAQAPIKFAWPSAADEIAVGILSGRKVDNPHIHAAAVESLRESASRILSCLIRIECNKDGAVLPVSQLR